MKAAVPCFDCQTTGGYTVLGRSKPYRRSGRPFGLDEMLCNGCYEARKRRAAGQPQKVCRPPLTPEQRQRAADHWRVAASVANSYHRQRPQLGMDFDGAAAIGICAAAQAWTPDKPYAFSTTAYNWAKSKCHDAIREERPRGFTGGPDAQHLESLESAGEPLSNSRPVGWEAEHNESFEAIVGRVPARNAQILRLVYQDGLLVREAAAKVGITEALAFRLKYDALATLREQMAGGAA